ncbi:hypothetical protein GCM10025867_31260 [Frondihabitans sucicola]|uniref:histidine kinase n=1 Tax=Frondihabitans sucicola TaxID=1268041 RepID=A0ABM8GR33_9MICO|nr:histidine kinase [Frondihabitans sucicola]BDZ50885.1 hypothetical protein GCM10025867_31260 [Frondihabitans sucicola]
MSERWRARLDGGAPRRGVWFPVILTLVLQLAGVVFALHAARFGAGHSGFGPSPLGPGGQADEGSPGSPTGLKFGVPAGVPVLVILLGFAASFALLARRHRPGQVALATGLLSASAIAFGSGPPLAALPLAVAVVAGIARGARVWVWSTLAGLALVVPLVAYLVSGSPVASIRPLVVALVLCFLVGLGEVVRNRRERFREISGRIAAQRRSEAEAERVRIARELHDVLAHSLSQISVQAGVGLHLFDSQPDRARESLENIRLTSGQALEEVRGVLGFLRGQGDDPARSPAPDLSRLPALVATMTRPGFEARLDDSLPSSVPPATQQAIYRIVQEALTNSSRHARATRVVVTLAAAGPDYTVTIVDDGRGADPDAPPAAGSSACGSAHNCWADTSRRRLPQAADSVSRPGSPPVDREPRDDPRRDRRRPTADPGRIPRAARLGGRLRRRGRGIDRPSGRRPGA